MRCELCGREIQLQEMTVPVEVRSVLSSTRVPVTKGIHLDCLKEIVESLRGVSGMLYPKTNTTNDEENN